MTLCYKELNGSFRLHSQIRLSFEYWSICTAMHRQSTAEIGLNVDGKSKPSRLGFPLHSCPRNLPLPTQVGQEKRSFL